MSTLRRISRLLLPLMLLFAMLIPVQAQEPVVYALLFYSPTCPHCHELIQNDLPPMQEEFGEQLIVLFVDVSTQGGNSLARAAYDTFDIPRDNWVVPMMIIGDTVMIGGYEIPTVASELIRTGLADGGIGLPPIPGLAEAYAQATGAEAAEAAEPAEAAESAAAAPVENVTAPDLESTVLERLARDPVANAIAVVVLVMLVVSLLVVLRMGAAIQQNFEALRTLAGRASMLVLIGAALIAGSLLLQEGGDMGHPVAIGALGLIIAALVLHFQGASRQAQIPLVVFAGIIVAAYMAYVEITRAEAVCGLVGNCNLVQQSEYSRLFGVLPIGVLGVFAYAALLLLWFWGRLSDGISMGLIQILALLGVGFSAYLTFLEPFIIGASCAWCLLSALLMMSLLWLSAPEGWQALQTRDRVPAEDRAAA